MLGAMCGRYGNDLEATTLAERLDAELAFPAGDWRPPGAVFPGTVQPILFAEGGRRRLDLARWGWRREFAKRPLINARDDKLGVSRLWHAALRRERCLVPAQAWFEWTGEPGGKQRHRLGTDAELLCFAALRDPERAREDCFTIITRAAVSSIAAIHDRMPAIVPVDRHDAWLDVDCEADRAIALLDVPPDLARCLWYQTVDEARRSR